jgi:hypothetical protein
LSLFVEGTAQVKLRDPVMLVDLQRVRPQSYAVLPILHLVTGHDGEKRQDRQAGGWQNGPREMKLPGPVGHTPAHHQKEADEGDVGVAIGAGLEINLDDPDHRHQRAEEPQPSYDQISMTPAGID